MSVIILLHPVSLIFKYMIFESVRLELFNIPPSAAHWLS